MLLLPTRFRVAVLIILAGSMSHQPDNIDAGTQVVSPVVVWGMNNPLLLSPGASGVVIRAPNSDLLHQPQGS